MEFEGKVSDLLRNKSDLLLTATPQECVYDALRRMGQGNVGALVVLGEEGQLQGVVTERDYARKVALEGRTSRETRVAEIMDSTCQVVGPEESISTCMERMTTSRVRYLPVVDEGGKLIGIVSIGDVVYWVLRSQGEAIQHLQGVISGGYPG